MLSPKLANDSIRKKKFTDIQIDCWTRRVMRYNQNLPVLHFRYRRRLAFLHVYYLENIFFNYCTTYYYFQNDYFLPTWKTRLPTGCRPSRLRAPLMNERLYCLIIDAKIVQNLFIQYVIKETLL